MKKNILVVVYAIFLVFIDVQRSGAQTSNFTPMNIVVILDTSNRISEQRHPGQVERDIEIIEEVAARFVEKTKTHISASKTLKYEDRFTVVIPSQPSIPPVPRKITKNLTIEGPREELSSLRGGSGILTHLDEQKEALCSELPKLYEFVGQHRQTGSDIWEWFKYQAESYFFESHQNIVICISDGYLNFDKNIETGRFPRTFMRVSQLRGDPDYERKIRGDQGLRPINKDFSRYKIDFLMTEIQLQTDTSGAPYQKDFQIITLYWETWLNSMGIKSVAFGKVGYPVGQKVRNLMQNR